jgi:hypothetical protein
MERRMAELTKAQALKMLRDAVKAAEGCGHSLEYGKGYRRRYDSETGEPYEVDDSQAILRCHNRKMRAIWDVWEAPPKIIVALEPAGRRALTEGEQHGDR